MEPHDHDRQTIITSLEKAIADAEARQAPKDELDRLRTALAWQLDDPAQVPPGQLEHAHITTLRGTTWQPYEAPPGTSSSRFNDERSLAKHQATHKQPPTSTPLHAQLDWWLNERQTALLNTGAFKLRAAAVWNPAYQAQKQRDLADEAQWRDYAHQAAAEIRRIRDKLRHNNKK